MSLLRHPNILPCLGASFDPLFMLMPRAEAALRNYIADGCLVGFERELEFCEGLARGVIYLHSCGIIHRDLKTDNVLVLNGSPVIMDFGQVEASYM